MLAYIRGYRRGGGIAPADQGTTGPIIISKSQE